MKPGDAGQPISVLLVCSTYPPVIGGSEVEAQRVCAALLRRGYRVRVVTAGGAPMPRLRDWVDPEGVPVRLYAHGSAGFLKNVSFALQVALMMIRERHTYRVVYFLMQGLHLAAGLPVAKLLRKPILMKIGGSGVMPLMSRSWTGRLELNWLRRWAFRVMILNDGMREEATRERFPADRLLWMPNPVDADRFRPASPAERVRLRDSFGMPSDSSVVLYTGRLAPEKAVLTLLDAFVIVHRNLPSARLVFVGDGPLRGELEAKALGQGLRDSVHFAGSIQPNDVADWLKIADVFALASPSEGFSCALVEAMAVGVPAVVANIPANRQLIDHDMQGLLVQPGNVASFASAIESLLRSSDLRERLGSEARQRVQEQYSVDKVVRRYEDLLRAAVGHA